MTVGLFGMSGFVIIGFQELTALWMATKAKYGEYSSLELYANEFSIIGKFLHIIRGKIVATMSSQNKGQRKNDF